jgi:predicted NAD/FAD-dependent oxidoreductase
MAGYDRVLGDNLPKFTEAITPDIRWLGLDSSKREQSPQSVVVLHSSPDYAVANFESPLEYLAPVLLTKGGVSNPDWLQVHRWRYAFPLIRLRTDYLISEDIPIFGCGDWCCDYLPPLEGAMTSAVALAKSLIKGE